MSLTSSTGTALAIWRLLLCSVIDKASLRLHIQVCPLTRAPAGGPRARNLLPLVAGGLVVDIGSNIVDLVLGETTLYANSFAIS